MCTARPGTKNVLARASINLPETRIGKAWSMHYPDICLEGLRKTQECQSGPMFWQRFEASTYRIRVTRVTAMATRSVAHLSRTFLVRPGEQSISRVTTSKQVHLYQRFAKTRHKRSLGSRNIFSRTVGISCLYITIWWPQSNASGS
jgi:hypothetical protein